jgi:SAM-dependent methyltransferase
VGPGRGSLHLELRRRVRGAIDAVERSPAFAAALRERCAEDKYGQGSIWQTDLLTAPLPSNTYDLIFARWVFCFLPQPDAHVRTLARALKPGGVLAIQDYAHRESFGLFPRPAEWEDFLTADHAFFASQGGDVSIGGRLPALYKKSGLALGEVTPVLKSGSPDSEVWDWLWRYFCAVKSQYATISPLTSAKVDRLYRHWRKAADDSKAFVIAPSMVDVVGHKT